MAQRLVNTVWDENARTITFFWYEGKDVKPTPMVGTDGQPVVFDLNKVPESLQTTLALHGAKQKTCDGFAGAEKDSGGNPTKKRELIVATLTDAIGNLYNDVWSERGEGVGVERVGLLIQAIARVRNVSTDVAKTWYDAQTDEIKNGLKSPKCTPIVNAIAAIKAEKPAKKAVDPASALAALDALA